MLSADDITSARDRHLVGRANSGEIQAVFDHLEELEQRLDDLQDEGFFGEDSWRDLVGIPEE